VVGVAVALFVAKVIAWYMTESVAILTDALESTVNVIAGFIGLYSLRVAAKPKDADHPYGHGKAEFISAAVEGTLVLVAGFIVIYESLNNFIHPHAIEKLDKGLILVAITALINYVIGYFTIKKGTKNNSLALIASATSAELTDPALAPNDLLYRLFHEDGVRVFTPLSLRAGCRCSRGRVEDMLRALPRDDVEHLKVEGLIDVTCEFCNRHYRFDDADLARFLPPI